MFCLESFKMIANGVSSFFIILSSVGYHKVYIINFLKKNRALSKVCCFVLGQR